MQSKGKRTEYSRRREFREEKEVIELVEVEAEVVDEVEVGELVGDSSETEWSGRGSRKVEIRQHF